MRCIHRILPVFLLCMILAVSGCVFPKQKLPYRPADEMSIWLSSIAGLSPSEQGRIANDKRQDKTASLALRDRALAIAAARPGSQGYAARTELSRIYASASVSQRAGWESLYWNELDAMDSKSMNELVSKISSTQETVFPWNLVLLKACRRGLKAAEGNLLSRVGRPELYANPGLFNLATPISPVSEKNNPIRIALAVPQTGSANALGKQIAAGASAAAERLKSEGKNIELRIIDTGSQDWQKQISALPQEYMVVGGPLLPNRIATAIGCAKGRALFVFAASLPAGTEGVSAWRFFTSRQDQLDSIFSATASLGITSFGIFRPEDTFAKKMGGLFLQEATSRGYSVTTGTYSSSNMGTWTSDAARFLKSEGGSRHGAPAANADFDAIFLPDSWKNMEMLAAGLQYNGAQDKLLIGTTLWEQSLGAGARFNPASFGHAIFPAAWNPRSSSPAALALKRSAPSAGGKADDWSALGFDFVRAASVIQLKPGWTASELNGILSSGLLTDWAASPFSWTESGQAKRKLQIMQPSSGGYAPADLKGIVRRITSDSN